MKLPVSYNQLTPSQRKEVREEYIKLQKGLCAHCGKPLNGLPSEEVQEADINWKLFPPFFQRYPIHLHHDHDTGLTLGAIHMRCNAWLWQYEGE